MAATVTFVPQEQIQRFRELQNLPYRLKIPYAIGKAQEFYEELDGKVFCSVGGLDSITLLYMFPQIFPECLFQSWRIRP